MFRFFKVNQKGIGLVEVLMAAAILCIAVAGISSFITQSKSFAVQVEGSTECRGSVESLAAEFSNNSSNNIANYIPEIGGSRGLASLGSEQNYYSSVADTGGLQLRNYQNIENSVTKAYLILRNNPTVCTNPNGVTITAANRASFFTNTAVFDRINAPFAATGVGDQVSISIVPFNFDTGQPLACGDLDISPLSQVNQNVQKGLRTIINITNNSNPQKNCRASTFLKYETDTSLPNVATTAAYAPTYPASANSNCTFSSTFTTSEPGSLLECSVDNGTSFNLCNSSTFNVATGLESYPVLLNPGSNKKSTDLNIGIGGFPNPSSTTILVRSIDTAGNRGPASAPQTVSCCVDTGWVEDAPGSGGTCVGSSVGTHSVPCGTPGPSVAGTLCSNALCPQTTGCDGLDSVTYNNCGAEIGRVGGGCTPSGPCLSSSACDGAGNMVTRDCNNAVTSTVPDASCVTPPPPTPSSYCIGNAWVNDDGAGTITIVDGCSASCKTDNSPGVCRSALGPRVVTDSCGNIIAAGPTPDPGCGSVAHSFNASMLCGRRGCNSPAWNNTQGYLASLDAIGIDTAAARSVVGDVWSGSGPCVNAINRRDTSNNIARGPNSGGAGVAVCSADASVTEDLYLDPYGRDFATCIISFSCSY